MDDLAQDGWSIFCFNWQRHSMIWVMIFSKVEFGNDAEDGGCDNSLVNLCDWTVFQFKNGRHLII